ncbi:unnamed protein product [Parnassius apollo]|uniref:receptor protein-tyrosine kinase n=1 Tax=Parnassius apollo TaxID=110799 RepID=A0A8S3XN95_PARAO|nr:unnamed protein product [Parnassius apollo]
MMCKAEDILKRDLPISFNQTKDLAEMVCSELFPDENIFSTCQKKFISPHRNNSTRPPKLTIKCQTLKRATFALTLSKSWKLVVLVPQDDNSSYINYILMEGYEKIGKIYTYPPRNYTFWTTALNKDGSPSLWLQGPEVKEWKSPEPMKYEIKTEILTHKYKNGSREIAAEFTWNVTDEADSCFDVFNQCKKATPGNYFRKSIQPDDKNSVVIYELPLGDDCTFNFTGKYGVTQVAYRTPECYEIDGCAPLPEKISNISIEVVQSPSGLGWSVHVTWKRPRVTPTRYNTTLYADTVYNNVLPGNATEVVYDQVTGEGLFNVTLVACTASGKAYSNRHGFLPPLAAQSMTVGILIGAAWLSALLFIFIAATVVYCKRGRSNKLGLDYFQGLQDKLCKEGMLEALRLSGEDVGTGTGVEGDRWEVHWSRLTLHEVVGEGAFGLVRRATLTPATQVAVKMLKDFPSADEVRSFRAEIELMKSVGAHPHVVSLVGCCSGRRPLIIAEYCSLGDLLTFLRCSWDVMLSKRNAKYYNNNKENVEYRNSFFKEKDQKQNKAVANKLYDLQGACDELTFLDLLSFCRQIAMGMEFLSSNRVVHRDLAARNVLVTGDKTLKIADFGLSRDIYQENQYKQKSNGKLPLKWMALESLTHRIFTSQSDVWSFGVVMWEVVTVGGVPYPAVAATRLPRLLRAGYRMPRPANCTPQLYEVMMSCWRARPCERPTFSQLHARLDALLAAACADTYLSLDLPADTPPSPTLPATLLRNKRVWERGESYEKPNALSNHYTSPPVTQPT